MKPYSWWEPIKRLSGATLYRMHDNTGRKWRIEFDRHGMPSTPGSATGLYSRKAALDQYRQETGKRRIERRPSPLSINDSVSIHRPKPEA